MWKNTASCDILNNPWFLWESFHPGPQYLGVNFHLWFVVCGLYWWVRSPPWPWHTSDYICPNSLVDLRYIKWRYTPCHTHTLCLYLHHKHMVYFLTAKAKSRRKNNGKTLWCCLFTDPERWVPRWRHLNTVSIVLTRWRQGWHIRDNHKGRETLLFSPMIHDNGQLTTRHTLDQTLSTSQRLTGLTNYHYADKTCPTLKFENH